MYIFTQIVWQKKIELIITIIKIYQIVTKAMTVQAISKTAIIMFSEIIENLTNTSTVQSIRSLGSSIYHRDIQW